jgi:periplasmic protein TonB
MNQQIISIIISLTIHAAIFGMLIGSNIKTNKNEQIVLVDLSNLSIKENKTDEFPLKKSEKAHSLHNEETKTNEQVLKEENLPANANDTLSKGNDQPAVSNIFKDNSAIVNDTADSKIVNTVQTEIESGQKQKLEKQYLSEQFQYIAKIIQKNTKYPVLAEEMGITGTVFMNFIVNMDGAVSEIDIIKSSGFEILDRDAEKTIIRSAPFPRPPIRVKLQFPLQYSVAN